MALCQPSRAVCAATSQPQPLRRRAVRCAARAEGSAESSSARLAAASFAAAVVLAGALGAPLPALAIPQTSACATNSCDDNDYRRARRCVARHLSRALTRCHLQQAGPAEGILHQGLAEARELLGEQPERRDAVRGGARRSPPHLSASPLMRRRPRALRGHRTCRARASSGRCGAAPPACAAQTSADSASARRAAAGPEQRQPGAVQPRRR